MNRKLKSLGLALVAMFAMSAIAATAAQATDEGRVVTDETTEGHVEGTLFGTDKNEANKLEFTAFPDESGVRSATKCAENNFLNGAVAEGTATAVTFATEFGGPLATQECEAGGFPATVFNNGCELHFDTFQTDVESTWEATADLTCPGAGIEVRAYSGGSHGFLVCRITVPPQNEIERVVAHNTVKTEEAEPHGEPHDITLTADANNITAEREGLCGSAHDNAAQMHGEVTVTAKNELEEPIDVYVEHHK